MFSFTIYQNVDPLHPDPPNQPTKIDDVKNHIFNDMKVALLSLRLKIPIDWLMKTKKLDLEKSFLSSQILRVIIQQQQEVCWAWAQIAGSQRRSPESRQMYRLGRGGGWRPLITAVARSTVGQNRTSMYTGAFSHAAQSFTRLPCFWPIPTWQSLSSIVRYRWDCSD